MKIKKIGKYQAIDNIMAKHLLYKSHWHAFILGGRHLTITKINSKHKQVYVKELGDWLKWNLPVRQLEANNVENI